MTYKPIPKIITIERAFLWKTIIQHCVHCDTPTVHALSKSQDYYACGCGEIINVEIKEENENE